MEKRQTQRTEEEHGNRGLLGLSEQLLDVAATLDSPASTPFDREVYREYQGGDLGTFESIILVMGSMDEHHQEEPSWRNCVPSEAQPHDLAHEYRVSLPFDEAERRWLVRRYRLMLDLWEQEATTERPVELLLRQSASVISAGAPKEVSGEELFARWKTWRAGEAPYESGDGVAQAQARMQELASFLILSAEERPSYTPRGPASRILSVLFDRSGFRAS